MAKAAEQAYYRFVVLFFNCMLTFGSYFCFDIPSILQDQFQGNLTCPNGTLSNSTGNDTGGCVEGLGMTPQEYNLLYAIYAWTNAVVVIMAGFLIDKLGNRFGVFLFSFLTVLGSAIFALGSYFKGTTYLLPLMLTTSVRFWKRIPHHCAEPHHGVLVPREGAGAGVWTDSGVFPLGFRSELFLHSEVRVSVWHAVDAVGRHVSVCSWVLVGCGGQYFG